MLPAVSERRRSSPAVREFVTDGSDLAVEVGMSPSLFEAEGPVGPGDRLGGFVADADRQLGFVLRGIYGVGPTVGLAAVVEERGQQFV